MNICTRTEYSILYYHHVRSVLSLCHVISMLMIKTVYVVVLSFSKQEYMPSGNEGEVLHEA